MPRHPEWGKYRDGTDENKADRMIVYKKKTNYKIFSNSIHFENLNTIYNNRS